MASRSLSGALQAGRPVAFALPCRQPAAVKSVAGGSARLVRFAMRPTVLPRYRAPTVRCAVDWSGLQIFQLSLPRSGRHPTCIRLGNIVTWLSDVIEFLHPYFRPFQATPERKREPWRKKRTLMALLPLSSVSPFSYRSAFPTAPSPRAFPVLNAFPATERKSRRKKKQSRHDDPDSTSSSSSGGLSVSTMEKGLRFAFMEELMWRARSRDPAGVADVIYDMVAAGLSPGPRSFHGLVVSHTLSGDEEGAVRFLFCALDIVLLEVAIIYGSKYFCLNLEELVRNHHLEDANTVFLKGAQGGLRATDELYDLLIKEDCKAGDHSNALTIAYEMEAAGRMATTFHFNCLLSVQTFFLLYGLLLGIMVQANCGIPEIAFATFENMEYGGE
ncbi:hypothetical protein BHE74_00035396, partial [Ensete ventricosum]